MSSFDVADHAFTRVSTVLGVDDLDAASRDRQSNRRVRVETRCADMSLTDDFAKVQLQAAKATKDLQEPRLGARPRRDLSFGFWAHARPLLTSRPRGSSDF